MEWKHRLRLSLMAFVLVSVSVILMNFLAGVKPLPGDSLTMVNARWVGLIAIGFVMTHFIEFITPNSVQKWFDKFSREHPIKMSFYSLAAMFAAVALARGIWWCFQP